MIDWTHWHNEPLLIGGLIFLGWLFAIMTGPLRPHLVTDIPYPRNHAIRFYSALVIFYLAVGSPLDQIGERFLLSAHMLQHQIIIYPAALLFLLGLPDWLVRSVTGQPRLQLSLRILTHPLVCGAIYTIVYSVWHLPYLYDWALQSRDVHILEHFTMFGAGLFYWWPLFSPSREFPRASYAWQMIFQVGVIIAMTPAFAYIMFSTDVLYPTYEYAPRIVLFGISMTAASDQLLAGAMMKLIGMTVAMIAFGTSFYRWYQTGDHWGEKKRADANTRPAGPV